MPLLDKKPLDFEAAFLNKSMLADAAKFRQLAAQRPDSLVGFIANEIADSFEQSVAAGRRDSRK